MYVVLGLVLLVHAFAHLSGCLVPWRVGYFKELSYKTTILGGAINLGDKGIRALGILWAILAAAFALSAVSVFALLPWWRSFTLAVSVISFFLCIAGWPDSRAGVLVNAAIILLLLVGKHLGWLPITGV